MSRNKTRSTRLKDEHERMLDELLRSFKGSAHKLVNRCLEYGLEAAHSGIDVFARNGSQDPGPDVDGDLFESMKLMQACLNQVKQQTAESHALALNNALDNFEVINWLRMIGESFKPGHTDDIERKIKGRSAEVMKIARIPPTAASSAQ